MWENYHWERTGLTGWVHSATSVLQPRSHCHTRWPLTLDRPGAYQWWAGRATCTFSPGMEAAREIEKTKHDTWAVWLQERIGYYSLQLHVHVQVCQQCGGVGVRVVVIEQRKIKRSSEPLLPFWWQFWTSLTQSLESINQIKPATSCFRSAQSTAQTLPY